MSILDIYYRSVGNVRIERRKKKEEKSILPALYKESMHGQGKISTCINHTD